MNNQNNQTNKQGQSMGFIDDYANDNIKNSTPIRKTDGKTVYANPLEDEAKPKRRITKNNRKRYRSEKRAYVALSVFLVAVVCLSLFFIIKNSTKGNTPTPEDTASDTTEMNIGMTEIPPETTENTSKSVTVSNEDIHKGNLILVNYKYKYIFPEEDILVNMYDKSSIYSVNATETYIQKEALEMFSKLVADLEENSGCDDVLVVSAFRSIEKQQEIYQDRLDRYGSEYAAAYVADPGYSEHHTGLAMDLQIYNEKGVYNIDTYEDSKWFMENYDKYGYILRYPAHKAQITAINFEGWHYRYVGVPHSLIMGDLDLCHEEYTDYLRDYTWEKPLGYNKNTGEITQLDENTVSSADNLYIIYYVPADVGDETKIPLISEQSYTVSGNNVDGFIVTVSPK